MEKNHSSYLLVVEIMHWFSLLLLSKWMCILFIIRKKFNNLEINTQKDNWGFSLLWSFESINNMDLKNKKLHGLKYRTIMFFILLPGVTFLLSWGNFWAVSKC